MCVWDLGTQVVDLVVFDMGIDMLIEELDVPAESVAPTSLLIQYNVLDILGWNTLRVPYKITMPKRAKTDLMIMVGRYSLQSVCNTEIWSSNVACVCNSVRGRTNNLG